MKINITHQMSNFNSHERTLEKPLQQNMPNKKTAEKNQKEVLTEKYKVEASVTKMNDFIEPLVTDLKFVFHEDLNEYYVTVVNPLTDEVIREIPPKKMLDMYAAMTEFIGILVDKKI